MQKDDPEQISEDSISSSDSQNLKNAYKKISEFLKDLQLESDFWGLQKSNKEIYTIDLKASSNLLGINFPKILSVQNALKYLGFNSCRSYRGNDVLITNAPIKVFFDILRYMYRMNLKSDPEKTLKIIGSNKIKGKILTGRPQYVFFCLRFG